MTHNDISASKVNAISTSLRAGSLSRARLLLLYAFVMTPCLGFSSKQHAAPVWDEAASRCNNLRLADLSGNFDAPTQVSDAAPTRENDDAIEYCDVSGYVAPSVGFRLRLPVSTWNGKLLALGCGGLCGTTTHIEECDGPLRRGYACMVNDQGHDSPGNLWIYNSPQAQLDISYRATHVSTLAGKEIIQRYYGRPPEKSYFMGCSAGGREAMMEAQRFPWDFDGIVAGCPSLAPSRNLVSYIWANRTVTDKSIVPPLTQTELDILHRAVVDKCDMNDGIADGLIGDPRLCNFEPSTLLCKPAQETQCLTERQVSSVTKLYGPPKNSKGEPLNLPFAMRGSERIWLNWFIGPANIPNAINTLIRVQARVWFLPDPGPDWRPEDFDLDLDYKRLGTGEALSSAVNPDLRQFKANGGKLLAYIGWNDPSMQLATIDYYETAEKTMGGRSVTQEFFRLFAIPGMEHCGGGDGASSVDWLSYLEAWVEQGHAPGPVIGSHARADDVSRRAELGDQDAARELRRRQNYPLNPTTVEFSRPIYPYPLRTKYLGHGDPRVATSFGPVTP